MIVLDADGLLIDMRYGRDPRFAINRQVLDHLRQAKSVVGITCQTLLEILGVSTFNLRTQDLLDLADEIPINYGLAIAPDSALDPPYAGVTVREVRDRIAAKMSLGDALTVLQVNRFVPGASCFLTWNAKHIQGQLAIPVLTPEEWWQRPKIF
jgi:hypothetical protein